MVSHAPDALRRARALYDSGTPVAEVAASLGLNDDAFRRLRKAEGWLLRGTRTKPKAARRRTKAAADKPPAPDAAEEPTYAALHAALMRIVQCEMQALLAAPADERGGEHRIRAVGQLTRTMTLLRGIAAGPDAGQGHNDDADAPPVDVAELRAELARRLHRLGESGDGS